MFTSLLISSIVPEIDVSINLEKNNTQTWSKNAYIYNVENLCTHGIIILYLSLVHEKVPSLLNAPPAVKDKIKIII